MTALDPGVAGQLAEDLPPEAFAAVVETFTADTARLLGLFLAADRAGDGAAFARAAHTMAGAAGAVGAKELERLARRALAEHDAPDREIVLRLARIHAQRAVAELRAMVRRSA